MTTISAYKRLNQWDNSSIRPGPVGSIGDALGQIRFKHSFPDQGIRLDPQTRGNKQNRLGSNVSDGNYKSFSTAGRGDPYVSNSPWTSYRGCEVSHGLIFQDVRAPDKLHEPYLGSLPQYSWQNKIATVYNAKRTGNLFLPLPGPYLLSPGEVPRGGMTPVLTDVQGLTYGTAINPANGIPTNSEGSLAPPNPTNPYYANSMATSNTGRPDIQRPRMF